MRVRLRHCKVLLIRVVMVVIVAIVVKRNAIEFLKWIRNFAHWGSEARVERHTLDLGGSYVYALAFLHIAEVGRFYAVALVRDNGWLHMTQ